MDRSLNSGFGVPDVYTFSSPMEVTSSKGIGMRTKGSSQVIISSQGQRNARLGSLEILPSHIQHSKFSEFATRWMAWHCLVSAIGGES